MALTPRWFWPLTTGVLLGFVCSYLAARSLVEVETEGASMLWQTLFWVFASPILGVVTALRWLLPADVLADTLLFLPIWLFHSTVFGFVFGVAAAGRTCRTIIVSVGAVLLLLGGLGVIGGGLRAFP